MQGHQDWGRVCRAKGLAEARASRQSGHSLAAALSVGPVAEQEAQLCSAPRRGAAWAWCWRWGKREGIVLAPWPGLGNGQSTLGWGEVGVEMMLEVGVQAPRGLIMVMFGEGGGEGDWRRARLILLRNGEALLWWGRCMIVVRGLGITAI